MSILNPEISRLNDELMASGSFTQDLIQQLEDLALKDQNLNQRLIVVLNQRQNARPLYLATSNLLLERARVFTEISANTGRSATLCRESAAAIEKMCSQPTETEGNI